MASGRRLDYLLISTAQHKRGFVTEVYNSALDGWGVGLPKSGPPLPPSSSEDASDHLLVFGDFTLTPSPVFVDMGFESRQLALYFSLVEPVDYGVFFELQARPAIGTGTWVRLNATLEWLPAEGRCRYLTSVPGAARREWRVGAEGP